jgi:hypothetical protein
MLLTNSRRQESFCMVRTLDIDLIPLVERLANALDDEEPVRQLQAVELWCVRFASRMGNEQEGQLVIDSMYKHVRQLFQQEAKELKKRKAAL